MLHWSTNLLVLPICEAMSPLLIITAIAYLTFPLYFPQISTSSSAGCASACVPARTRLPERVGCSRRSRRRGELFRVPPSAARCRPPRRRTGASRRPRSRSTCAQLVGFSGACYELQGVSIWHSHDSTCSEGISMHHFHTKWCQTVC